MTRSEALAALIAKVEAGTAEGRLGDDDFWQAFPDGRSSDAYGAYHGYLDAAAAFVDAALPGWGWEAESRGGAMVSTDEDWGEANSPGNPARALLLAALRALAAQEDDT